MRAGAVRPRRARALRARRSRGRLAAAFCALCMGLASCSDDARITHVHAEVGMTQGRIARMAADGPAPAEIHGAPYLGASDADVAALIRLPQRIDQSIRFAAVAPGAPPANPLRRRGVRLVIIFNPETTPDFRAVCRLTAEAPTLPPPTRGVTLALAFCDDENPIGQAILTSAETDPRSGALYDVLLRRVFDRILRSDSARLD